MTRITYDEYLAMLRDPDVPDSRILEFSVVKKGDAGPFDPEIAPDPDKVEMTFEDIEAENAMKIGNSLCRFRRHLRFKRRLRDGVDLPVLVSEGDSWFQFPLLIDEVIDNLENDYLIYDVSAAGDTAANMIRGQVGKKKTEYMKALRKQKDRVRAFLISAAGNDVIGEDENGVPVLEHLLKPFQPGGGVAEHVNHARLAETLAFLRGAYAKVIADIRAEPGFEKLPIIIHGYDYPFPHPWGADDPRDPIYAAKDEWLGEPLAKRGIHDPALRRDIIKFLLNALYDLMEELSGEPSETGVYIVDCRGAMPNVGDWADEIHGTSAGFAKVAPRFRQVIANALASVPVG